MLVARLAPILASLVWFATPAAAADTETRIGIVSTEGLDLTSPSGQARLHARIRQEVHDLCGEPGTYDELSELNAVRSCRENAMRDVAPQVAAAEHAAMTAQSRVSTKVSAAN
jgi:UrcA family protein